MRDLVVFLLFLGVLPMCFLRPWIGVCTFTFLAYHRTQDLTWGFARNLPLSQFIGLFMIAGWLIWDPKPLPLRSARTKAMVALVFWIGISIFLNTVRWAVQGDRYIELIKIVLVALLTGALCTGRVRLRHLYILITLALGFYGVKNGLLFCIGKHSIAGPGGMLKDNNDFALAMVMNMPFLYFMGKEFAVVKHGKWLARFCRFGVPLNALAIMSTSSRGAFLSLSVGAVVVALKSRYRTVAIGSLIAIGMLGVTFAPKEYKERIASTFASGDEQDGSIKGRLVSWLVAKNMIIAYPMLGIGFNNMVYEYNNHTEGITNPEGGTEFFARVTHNSYLQIWSESGTPAFLLWFFMVSGSIVALERIGRKARREGDLWAVPYANAVEVSLISFMVGATFLNRAHFDLIYQLVVISAILPRIILHERKVAKPRRKGPRLAQTVSVENRDPFVRVATPWAGTGPS